jgi:hypothetical protein
MRSKSMSEGLHPVVDLMLARMKSNPEEFADRYGGRWSDTLMQITDCGSDAEIEAIREGTRSIILDRAHAQAMDELLNGDERRAKAERNLMAANRTAQAVAQLNASANLSQYQNAIGIGTQTSSQSLVINTAGQEAMRITANGNLNIGGETLDADTIKKMKSALGLK